jgi:hypothetical protein
MKKLMFAFVGMVFVSARTLAAADQPRGNLVELHSCELYAGGCVVSSEATLGGRYMFRAWEFTGGTFAGTDLAGLNVALLQTSSENLAAEKTKADRSVVYLPQSASRAQREALAAWLKNHIPELKSGKLSTRIAPIKIAGNGTGYSVLIGDSIAVRTAGLESCETGACGEALWYEPRSGSSLFTVALNRSSRVTEPLLKLKWDDAGKRSVFIGKFGDTASTKKEFVTSSDWCGPAEKVF